MHVRWAVPVALLLAGLSAPAAARPEAAAPAARFERSIAATKQAMLADPQRALAEASAAARLAGQLPGTEADVGRATAQWLEGEALIGLNRLADAKPVIARATATVERHAPDTKLHGDLMRARGAIAAMEGRLQEALADYQQAHSIFRKARIPRSQAIALQDIGQIYWDAGDYERVLSYFSQSEEVYRGDPGLTLTMLNNRGEVLRAMGRFAEAEADYQAALRSARALGSTTLETRILTNLATAQADAGKLDAAAATVARGQRLAASSETAEWRTYLLGVSAKIALKRGNHAEAARLIGTVFAGADFRATAMQDRELHELAADIYQKVGSRDLAFEHLRAFQRLDREARDITATNSAQLMAARFDFANQNLRITQLKQGQLERDIRIERERSRFRTTLLGGLLAAGAVVSALLLFGFLSIRKSRNETRAANHTLTGVNAALEKALKIKSEFLATTSHEIRTPLNGILGMTQVLLADRSIDPALRGRIEVVHGAGETMKALVDDILDVAKLESGEVSVAAEPVAIAPILEDAARLWRDQARAKGVALRLETAGIAQPLLSDGARIRQIVFNLMSNAVKFTLAGEVVLAATVEDGEAGSELVIRVSDTGIGIAESDHALIFESFRQVDSATTRQFGGTGLGLAICQRLTDALGGRIAVDSSLGNGATFTVRLPYVAAALSDTAEQPGAAGEPRLGDATLLLVERNPANQGLLRILLTPAVGTLLFEADGDAMRARLAEGGIDHLLVEAGALAEEGGSTEPHRRLAEEARRLGIKLSLLFAPGGGLTIADMLSVGASQVIVKPIGAADLIRGLESLYTAAPVCVVAPSITGQRAA